MAYTNTLARYPISDGWAAHRSRGSLGGIDYAVGVGTPIPAPCNGRLQNIPYNGSGGHTATFFHEGDGLGAGWRDQYMHLSQFVGEGYYKAGDIIGYSGGRAGADGAGSSTGPHVHHHLINPSGTRVNPQDYFTGASSSSGSTASSVAQSAKGVQQNLASMGLYDGAIDGIPGPKTWRGVQTVLKSHGLYDGPIDGIPGPKTYRGFQEYGKKNGNYAPPGVIDGILGPLSWAGFLQTLVEDIDANNKAKAAAEKAAAEAKAAADKAAEEAAAAKAKAEEDARLAAEAQAKKVEEEAIAKTKEVADKPIVKKKIANKRAVKKVFADIENQGGGKVQGGIFTVVKSMAFWNDTLTRAINTAFQVALAAVGTGAAGITEIPYTNILDLAAGGALISILMSFVRATTPKE